MADKGLREVIAADTQLSDIDGEKGTPFVRRVRDRAISPPHSSFEEVVYLLHHLELPTARQLDALPRSSRTSGTSTPSRCS